MPTMEDAFVFIVFNETVSGCRDSKGSFSGADKKLSTIIEHPVKSCTCSTSPSMV